MPEYLTPGVYLEETSFRSRSIEGVPTSTFGMAGLTRYGPVAYRLTDPGRALSMTARPPMVGSFTEFERIFGGLQSVGNDVDTPNYLAYAARAFFDNGGQRLYVSRVFPFATKAADGSIDLTNDPFASFALGAVGTWRARWPGLAGNTIWISVGFQRSKNVLVTGGGSTQLVGLTPGAAVELFASVAAIPKDRDKVAPVKANIRMVGTDATGKPILLNAAGTGPEPAPGTVGCHIRLQVTVGMGDTRLDTYTGLEVGTDSPRFVGKALGALQPTDEFSLVWLDLNQAPVPAPADLLAALLGMPGEAFLTGAADGATFGPDMLKGEDADPDDATKAATGLAALAEIDDIAIVATPDSVRFDNEDEQKVAVDYLIEHCTALRYRVGIVDPPSASASVSGVREFRSRFDTSYAALYYPWVQIIDPLAKNDPGAPPATLELPPSGFAAGIYARSDIARGVHKAPANEVVLGITKFLQNVTYDRQAVLNPEGVNALRFFPGRSNRVWGARTMSSDPEWKYVNVRRLFCYLEHSIDKSTQWSVFEPNNESLWASVRQTITDFLVVTWHSGALMGTKPEEAFFVRCDRTTMTQNDLDNGRLICLIGVAPTYPAEFVIFRIGQWTADAQQS